MTLPRHPDVRVLSSTPVASGRVFEVVRETLALPSGLRQDLLLIDHPGAVVVLAEDDAQRIAVVRQYRHAIGRWLLELPAGRLERGEDRRRAAQRELEEEAGLRARSWSSLGCFYPAPGFCSEEIEIFWAREVEEVRERRLAMDDDEEISVEWMPWREARVALAQDAKSALSVERWLAQRAP